MKKNIIILLYILAIAITSCKNNDVYFVYSPKMPHAGQTIVSATKPQKERTGRGVSATEAPLPANRLQKSTSKQALIL